MARNPSVRELDLMDVEQRFRGEAVDRPHAHRVAPVTSSNRWVLPVAVAGAVVVGALSVPFLMWLGPNLSSPQPAALDVVTSEPAADESPLESAPTATRALSVPSAVPTMSLAAPPPPPPTRSMAPSASVTDLGGRRASVVPASGVGGQLVTVSGACVPGTDTQVSVGSQTSGQAVKAAVAPDGTFSVRVQAGASGKVGQTVAVPVSCLPAAGGKGVTFSAPFTVTAVVTMPADVPGDAGQLQVDVNGQRASASGAAFMPGTPVLFQVRNLDKGVAESQRRVLSDDTGAVDVLGVDLATGRQQLVMSGVGQDGARRVLATTVTVGGEPSTPSAAAASPST